MPTEPTQFEPIRVFHLQIGNHQLRRIRFNHAQRFVTSAGGGHAITLHRQRLRENIKALKGSAEEKALLQRYTKQLNGQESRLEELKKTPAAVNVTSTPPGASARQTSPNPPVPIRLIRL